MTNTRGLAASNRNFYFSITGNIQNVNRIPGGQQALSKGTCWLHEFQLDGAGSAGYISDGEVTVVDHLPVLGVNIGDDDLVRVGIVDTNGGDALLCLNQFLLNGEGSDTGGDVAAVALVAYQGLVHADSGRRYSPHLRRHGLIF